MVSLLFSFMVIWDLPNLRRGMKALKTSRLAFAYNTISPQVSYHVTRCHVNASDLSMVQGRIAAVPGDWSVQARSVFNVQYPAGAWILSQHRHADGKNCNRDVSMRQQLRHGVKKKQLVCIPCGQ